MTQVTTPDRYAIQQARTTLRDLVSIPVAAWMALSPARRTVDAYRWLLGIPLDLSAAGYQVSTIQTGAGWSITIEKAITETAVLHLQGEATRFAHALFQVADQIDFAIGDLEARAKRAARDSEYPVEAAAG